MEWDALAWKQGKGHVRAHSLTHPTRPNCCTSLTRPPTPPTPHTPHAQVVREQKEHEAIRKRAKFISQQSAVFWGKAQRVVATKVCVFRYV